jgi:hypothetical protein
MIEITQSNLSFMYSSFFLFSVSATFVEAMGRAEGQRHRLHNLPQEGQVPQAFEEHQQRKFFFFSFFLLSKLVKIPSASFA